MIDLLEGEYAKRKKGADWRDYVAAFFLYVFVAWAMSLTSDIPPALHQEAPTPVVSTTAAAPDQITQEEE